MSCYKKFNSFNILTYLNFYNYVHMYNVHMILQKIKFKVYKKSFVIKEVDLDLWKFGENGTDPSDYGFRYDLVWSINILFGLAQKWLGLVQEWFCIVWIRDAGTDPSDHKLRYGLVWFGLV